MQMHEKSKPALLGKYRYSSDAIRYKVAGYVEEIVVKMYPRSRVSSSMELNPKKPDFVVMGR